MGYFSGTIGGDVYLGVGSPFLFLRLRGSMTLPRTDLGKTNEVLRCPIGLSRWRNKHSANIIVTTKEVGFRRFRCNPF